MTLVAYCECAQAASHVRAMQATRFSVKNGAKVLADGVTCVGFADRGSIQADVSLRPSRFGFFSAESYFEAKVLASKGKVAVGISTEKSTERIGWLQRQDSVALGDSVNRIHRLLADGYNGQPSDAPGLAALKQGDVVGCGLRWADPSKTAVDVFFTRNGARVATAKRTAGAGLSETFARARAQGGVPNLLPSIEISEGESVMLDLKGPFLYAPASHAEDGSHSERGEQDKRAAGTSSAPSPAAHPAISAIGVPPYASMDIRKELGTADFYYPGLSLSPSSLLNRNRKAQTATPNPTA